MMAAASRSAKPVERQARHMRLASPRRVELGPESYDQQHRKSLDPVHSPIDRLKARRVDPMHILEDHQHRILSANPASCAVRASSVLCLRCCGASSSAG